MPQDEFEIPKIAELISQLRDMKYFSVIDLKDGFFHINIRPQDKEKTTFYTGSRLMQFVKMPQGYKNSPAIFQRAINLMFSEIIGKKCLIYIDDILVFGKTSEEHKENLNEVLTILKKYNLEENKDKIVECAQKVVFLGYEIEHNKIRPTQLRSQGICEFPSPKNRKQVQRFLGMLNYDRQFIKNLSGYIQSLYRLLEKDKKFVWDDAAESAFKKVKEKWKEELEIYIPDMNGEFELESDASNVGIGAVLRQNGRPVGYISRTLSKSEKNYSITEKEVLAAIWAMEKYKYYLTGKKFVLITDHKAIEELKKKREFGSARIYRWFERLERFQFEVKYREGVNMVVADALSRAPAEKFEEREEDRKYDEEKILRIHEELNHRKIIGENLSKGGIIISANKLSEILNKCEVCSRKDKLKLKTCQYIAVEKPGDRVGIDILEIKANDKVVMAIDYFSRKLFARCLNTKEGYKIVEFLESVYKEFPFKSMITDNVREFDNKKVQEWTDKTKVRHILSIPYYHQSNGRIERANRTIRNALRKSSGPTKKKLQGIIRNYNNLPHRGTGISPEEATKTENHDKVMSRAKEYGKEFNRTIGRKTKLVVNDNVWLRNELKRGKMDDEFDKKGVVVENVYGDVYKVKVGKGKTVTKHISQLRRF